MRIFYSTLLSLLFLSISNFSFAQFPGCPDINAGPDQVLPCTQNCTNLTATPFATGQTTSYTVGGIPHTPPIAYNAPGGTAVSVGTDDVWSPITTLPFNFCYYGNVYNTVNIGSNGSIQFGPSVGGGGQPWSFTASCPSTALINAGDVYGVYHDTDPSVSGAGAVKWYLLGVAPCRIYVVVFNNQPHFQPACHALRTTSMIVLYETTNVIDVYVQAKPICTTWNGGRAIIGIQNPTGTAGIAAPGRNATPTWTVTTPEAWRFLPSGAPNYVITWLDGATPIGTGATINVCPGGPKTYTARCVYTNCDGTIKTEFDNVSVSYGTLVAPVITPVAEVCANTNTGSVTINNPVGAGPYTVTIAGPTGGSVVEPNTAAGVANFTNLPDGSYTYTTTGANGCTGSGSFTIAAGANNCCSIALAPTNVLCAGSNTGLITSTPTGSGPYTYAWTGPGGPTGQSPSGLGAGAYSVTMTTSNGCVATANTTITAPTALTATATFIAPLCNGLSNGSLTVTPAGGTGPFTYSVSSINAGAFQASNVFTGLPAGTYFITVRGAAPGNCTATLNVTITQPPALTIGVPTAVAATCGFNNGTASVTAAGGSGAISYSINSTPVQNNATGSFTTLAAGTYTITASTGTCTITAPVTVPSSAGPVPTIISQTNLSCFGVSSSTAGTALIGTSGGVGPYQYQMDAAPFGASNSFGSLAAGSHTVTVRDINLCVGTVTFTITQPTVLAATFTPVATACFGTCTGSAVVVANGGTAPYTYSSNNGVSYVPTSTIPNLCAQAYNILVRDNNGCIISQTINITQPTAVNATFTPTPPLCRNGNDGEIFVVASGGTPSYNYSVDGSAFQVFDNLIGLSPGNHTVTVRDVNNCLFSGNMLISNPAGFLIVQDSTDPSNCLAQNGNLYLSVQGTFLPNITWSSPDLIVPPTILSASAVGYVGIFAGSNTIIATDGNGCRDTSFFGVSDVEMSGIQLGFTDATCFGANDGSVTVINSQGFGLITYVADANSDPLLPQQSNTGNVNVFFGNVGAGNHAIELYDFGNCYAVIPFVINEPTLVTFNTQVSDVSCNGGSTGAIQFINTIGGTGSYQFDIGTGLSANPNFTGLPAGTYNVSMIDANNCPADGIAIINESTPVVLVLDADDLLCAGDNSGLISAAATGGTGTTTDYTYALNSNAAANFSPAAGFAPLAAGTYTVFVRDLSGCEDSEIITLAQPIPLALTVTSQPTLCNVGCTGIATLTATGGTTTYQYSPDNGTTFYVSNILNGLCSGSATFAVKDLNACIAFATHTITAPTALTLAVASTPATCGTANGSLSLTANGGATVPVYSYSSTGPTGTFGSASVFNSLNSGSYNLSVQNQNGCITSTPGTIANLPAPSITNATGVSPVCNLGTTGTINIASTGGTGTKTYTLTGPSIVASQTGVGASSNVTFTGLGAGTWTATVTDASGCTDTETITLTQPADLSFTTVTTNLLCNNVNTGSIAFTVNGGVSPYQYSLDGGVTFPASATTGFLAAGLYNLTVKDFNNCLETGSVTITQPTVLAISTSTSTNLLCNAICNGSAGVTMTGGTTPYTFAWINTASVTNSATGLCAGGYDLTITDFNGCAVTTNFTITEPPALVISSFSATQPLCFGDCNGSIQLEAPLAVDYSLDNVTFQAASLFTGLCVGNYTVYARDANGCVKSIPVILTQPTPLVQNPIAPTALLICYDGFGTLSASASGGTTPYTFVWDGTTTVQYLNVTSTTDQTYSCIVTDANGCVSPAVSQLVTVRPPFVANVTNALSACPGQSVTGTGSGSGGLAPYSYMWLNTALDTLANGNTYTYVPTGPDTLLMEARDECYQRDTLQVIVSNFIVANPIVSTPDDTGCSPFDATISIAGNTANIASVNWNYGDGTTSTGLNSVNHQYLAVGCYNITVEITTLDGCIADSSFANFVCVAPDPIADFTFNPAAPTTIESEVTFVNTSVNAVSFAWNFGLFGTSSLENPILNFGIVEAGSKTICLEVTSPEGCVNEICKPIVIVEDFNIFVPNTFTPDGDKANNEFKPIVAASIVPTDYTLLIFNRWGEIIFESKDISVGWDGTYGGNVVQDGAYTWKITFKISDNAKIKDLVGHVNL